MKKSVAVLVLLCMVAGIAPGKQKQRQWQTGKVLDVSRDRTYAGSINDASGNATTSGDTTYANASGSSTAVYRVYETYKIESADFIYVCEERIRWRWSKPAQLTVNGPVRFAIEKDHLFIRGEDDKEHKTTIIKKILKLHPTTGASAKPKN